MTRNQALAAERKFRALGWEVMAGQSVLGWEISALPPDGGKARFALSVSDLCALIEMGAVAKIDGGSNG